MKHKQSIKYLNSLGIILLVLFSFLAMANPAPNLSKLNEEHAHPGYFRLVNDAKRRITEISVHKLAEKLKSGVPFYLIDVRESEENKQGAIPKSIHLSKGIIESDIEQKIPDYNADIVVYCRSGKRSALVADNLQKMGYHHVSSLKGGFQAWVKAGLPST